MRLSAFLAAGALLLAACGDPSSSPAPASASRPLAAVVVAPCAGCAYGVVRFDRTLGGRFEQATFAASPAAAWVLVVTDDGNARTGAEVLLNGTQRVAKVALEGAPSEVRIPVPLLASNTLLVRVFGDVGASVRVSLEPAPVATLTVTPPTSERLPGGTQQFSVASGPPGPYVWSVNGIDGGNATFGTVSSTGFYTAPSAVPSPASFQLCARVASNPAVQGCATVTISAVPTAGEDVVVINDMNLFDDNAMANADNQRFARNLATYVTTGPRGTATGVIYDRGRASPCFADGECGDDAQDILDGVLESAGFSITKRDAVTSYAAIPANVKLIILFNPTIAFTRDDINGFKQFAAQGGRIVWVGEWLSFYGSTGIAIENQFMRDMGAQLTNVGDAIDCGYNVLPSTSLRPHQLTAGMTDITFACGSRIIPGPNDFPFLYDLTNTHILGALAKIDVTPLPASSSRAAPVATPRPARPTVDGVGRRIP